jgi:predicted RNA-binding protein YlxR (DUF448 family)
MDTDKLNLRKGKIPERTCIGCRKAKPKNELIRIVGSESGGVTIAPSGRHQGRSAYMCKTKACWESGLKKDRLGLSLRMNISKEVKDELARFGETLAR